MAGKSSQDEAVALTNIIRPLGGVYVFNLTLPFLSFLVRYSIEQDLY